MLFEKKNVEIKKKKLKGTNKNIKIKLFRVIF